MRSEIGNEDLYCFSWKYIHIISISLLLAHVIFSSFGHPLDLHCNIEHEGERRLKEKEERQNYFERMAADNQRYDERERERDDDDDED